MKIYKSFLPFLDLNYWFIPQIPGVFIWKL